MRAANRCSASGSVINPAGIGSSTIYRSAKIVGHAGNGSIAFLITLDVNNGVEVTRSEKQGPVAV